MTHAPLLPSRQVVLDSVLKAVTTSSHGYCPALSIIPGLPGTGKTHLLHAIHKSLNERSELTPVLISLAPETAFSDAFNEDLRSLPKWIPEGLFEVLDLVQAPSLVPSLRLLTLILKHLLRSATPKKVISRFLSVARTAYGPPHVAQVLKSFFEVVPSPSYVLMIDDLPENEVAALAEELARIRNRGPVIATVSVCDAPTSLSTPLGRYLRPPVAVTPPLSNWTLDDICTYIESSL